MDLERAKQETGSQTPEAEPVMCKNICGFFGSATTMGLCSKCYTEYVLQQASTSRNSTIMEAEDKKKVQEEQEQEQDIASSQKSKKVSENMLAQPMECCSEGQVLLLPPPVLPSEAAVVSRPDHQSRPPPPNRCGSCRKRVGLTGFKCRCGNTYCALHRYSDKHNCSYDYKAAGQEAIAKANPLVIADKVVKI